MSTLDEFKQNWESNQPTSYSPEGYTPENLENIFKKRMKKQMGSSFQYFLASLVWQIIVYALLTHVIIRYWADRDILLFSITGILSFVPFTFILLRRFKAMGSLKIAGDSGNPLFTYTAGQLELLQRFYLFKKRYELVLIPVSSVIGVFLTFQLYVPGAVQAHPAGAIITLIITLASCMYAIFTENKKSFKEPIKQLRLLLEEFRQEL